MLDFLFFVIFIFLSLVLKYFILSLVEFIFILMEVLKSNNLSENYNINIETEIKQFQDKEINPLFKSYYQGALDINQQEYEKFLKVILIDFSS